MGQFSNVPGEHKTQVGTIKYHRPKRYFRTSDIVRMTAAILTTQNMMGTRNEQFFGWRALAKISVRVTANIIEELNYEQLREGINSELARNPKGFESFLQGFDRFVAGYESIFGLVPGVTELVSGVTELYKMVRRLFPTA
jgi:hypothetical protein